MGKKAVSQSDRRASKRASQQPEEDSSVPASTGSVLDLAKTLVFDSCLLKVAPPVLELLQDRAAAKPDASKAEETKVDDSKEKEQTATEEILELDVDKEAKDGSPSEDAPKATMIVVPQGSNELFDFISARLQWHNSLGLGMPQLGEDSWAAWCTLKGLSLDWGPRKSRKGSPSLDRIKMNLYDNLTQYLHILLAMMLIRCFIFRSFFTCLPFLLGLQIASLKVPFSALPQVPVKFRVVGTVGIHALVWLFFLFEALWKTYFFEKLFLVGLFAFHAHSVRPVSVGE
jgi:hypothetical protein